MKKTNSTFYCFSPPVMIATFAVEIILLSYVIIRYKMSPVGRLIASALVLLAVFQFAEFNVCESIGTTDIYSRIGYVSITLLPAVGIHLVSKIASQPSKKLVWGAYISSIMFALVFGLSSSAFDSYACAGNYAVFHLNPDVGYLYTLYYYGWLFTGLGMCLKFQRNAKKKIQQALQLQAVGYLSFMLPTGIVNIMNPTTLEGAPSIMCGFAVIYAFILAFGIAPRVLKSAR